ncbi:oxygen-independent coproporphyrinogen III oxidase [Daejeonella oryzae]|uniref:oxygen-independent coproporphyrinogen III oxidase n=1 Tax=Daejeonella oryzae TaxID=1122943 RepID=UPI0004123BA0|nr:oxygen-independent coproporphyrinogen III oxidase [Daejeonella oryzae]
MTTSELIKKYNVAAPRYTSYPTVPYWETEAWTEEEWLISVKRSYREGGSEGISLYIHLPFCESLCTYCGCNTRITKNHTVEDPYLIAVIKEWKMYCEVLKCKPLIREIHLGGGTPTFFNPNNLEKLTLGILNEAEVTADAEFSFEAHPANTTLEHLVTLYNLGFRRLSLGIQDFDPKVQEIINRKQSVEQVQQVTSQARNLGYTSINYDLIYGLPLQQLSSVENTIREVIKLMPDRISFYSYAHVPWLKPGQRRFTENDLPAADEKRALYEKGLSLLKEAGYADIGMDHFALKTDSLYTAAKNQTLHRNFMGYTHQYTQLSIGLGVSSISDSWYGFAQNVKQLDSYLNLISDGKLPLFKGHILTSNDLKYRKIILHIMCRGFAELDLEDPQLLDILVRLSSLQKDRLIHLEDNRLQVTIAGQAFLRNICMAFDERLWEKQPESQIFSTSV